MGSNGEQQPVDFSSIGKSLWLIKVPKNLENALMRSKTPAVGSLTVTRQTGKKPVMTFYPSSSVLSGPAASTSDSTDDSTSSASSVHCVGDSYSIDPLPVDRLTLSVFSETDYQNKSSGQTPDPKPNDDLSAFGPSGIGNVRFEGCIKTRGEMKPPKSNSYLKLKAMEFKHQNIPTKLTKLTSEVNNFKPRSHAVHNVLGGVKGKGGSGGFAGARMREDVDVVKDKIFKAFELHQYYNILDLQKKTGQPVNYLKEILTEIADYNTSLPHRFTWELKPQYRHYDNSATE